MAVASRDGGVSWAEPVRVNDNPRSDGTRQYLPQIEMAPGGRLDVLYDDRRGDPDNVFTERSLQASTDGRPRFTDRVRLSDEPFDSRIGFGGFRGMPELGTRLALVSTDIQALGVWADTRAGTEASGKQDRTQAVVRFTGGWTQWTKRTNGVVPTVIRGRRPNGSTSRRRRKRSPDGRPAVPRVLSGRCRRCGPW